MQKRSIKILSFILFCLVGSGCNTEENKGEYFIEGVKLFDQGEFAKSEIEIKNALQEDPAVSDAHYYMALLNEKARKFKAMKGSLLEAVKLDPTSIKAKLKLAKVYLLYNELDKANEETKDILTINPENLDALSLTASIKLRGKEFENALEIVEGILQKDASHLEAISLKVILLTKKNKFDEALTLLSSALKDNEDNMALRLLKIQVDSLRNDIDAVVEDYEIIARLKPNNIQIRNALAKIYLKANQKSKAEKIFRALVHENPGKVSAKIELLNFLYLSDVNEALNQLDKFKQNNKENYPELMVFSKWLIVKNLFEDARSVLKSIVVGGGVSDSDKESALLILAKIDVTNKKFESGLSYIEQILKGNSDSVDAKLLKAKVFIAKDNYNSANKILEEILWHQPGMDQALSLLGEVNVMQGDQEKAAANFNEAFRYNPKNVVALNFIVAKAIREGHVDHAITTLESVLQYSPRQLSILAKLVNLNILKNDWDNATKYIKTIQNQKNGAIFAGYLRGKLLQTQKKFKEAILVYKGVLEKTPWFKDALFGINECYLELNQQEVMKQYLGEFIKNNPKITSPYILKSQFLVSEKKYSKAIQLLNNALAVKEVDPVSIYVEKAKIYKVLGQKDKVFSAYKKGLDKDPGNIEIQLLLASFYEKDLQYAQAVALYEKILLINSRHKVAKNNLATLLVDHFGKDKDISKAVHLVKAFGKSKQAYYLDTYGWVQYKSGHVEEALAIFKKVIILKPEVPVFRYHLAVAYSDMNDLMSAKSELRQAIYLGKEKKFTERLLAEQLLKKVKNNNR